MRQGTGWTTAAAQELVTFLCEGCTQRFPASQLFEPIFQWHVACSYRCVLLASQTHERQLRTKHAFVCDTAGCACEEGV